jgi:hypothetical protein
LTCQNRRDRVEKVLYGNRSTAARSLAWALVMAGTLAGLAACQHRDPVVHPVPVVSAPLAACDDTDGYGPCAYLDDAAGDGLYRRYVVAAGHRYPDAVPVALYVPQCPDVALHGPCVGLDGVRAQWSYVAAGATWPYGLPVPLCPSENGAPDGSGCVWVPDVQGAGAPGDDAGAYLWGMTS